MVRKLQISLVLSLLVALVGAVAVYAWDAGQSDRIADGVRVGTVDLGGLEREEATERLRGELIAPLRQRIVVPFRDERFKLGPKELRVRADVEGMVDAAVEASRGGGLLTRTFRRINGNEVDHRVEPTIAYSKRAVRDFVDEIAAHVDREPVDASVEPSASSIEPVASKNGRSLDREQLNAAVEEALHNPYQRRVKPEVSKVEPEVTTEQLAERYPTYITVDRGSFKLHLYKDLELAKTYTVALGKLGHDTPTGLYSIQNKAVDPVWHVPDSDWAGDLAGEVIPPGPDNPLKARWLGIYNGAGIHGTADEGSLGSNASHGCIRMAVPDVIELYDRVATGTPIYIS